MKILKSISLLGMAFFMANECFAIEQLEKTEVKKANKDDINKLRLEWRKILEQAGLSNEKKNESWLDIRTARNKKIIETRNSVSFDGGDNWKKELTLETLAATTIEHETGKGREMIPETRSYSINAEYDEINRWAKKTTKLILDITTDAANEWKDPSLNEMIKDFLNQNREQLVEMMRSTRQLTNSNDQNKTTSGNARKNDYEIRKLILINKMVKEYNECKEYLRDCITTNALMPAYRNYEPFYVYRSINEYPYHQGMIELEKKIIDNSKDIEPTEMIDFIMSSNVMNNHYLNEDVVELIKEIRDQAESLKPQQKIESLK